jgi:tripartite-type tricarboxylate transporter receptor subunit TctC
LITGLPQPRRAHAGQRRIHTALLRRPAAAVGLPQARQQRLAVGRAVVVDNKPGGNGIIGVEAARTAPADGSVLLLATTSTHLANPALFHKLPYDPGKDFSLVGSFGPGSTYLLVHPDAPYKTLQDFVRAAKAAPGKLNYGHFNATSKVTAALFAHEAGIALTAIPYKQVGQAMSELMAGQIQVVFTDTVQGDSFVASGQLRAGRAQRRAPQALPRSAAGHREHSQLHHPRRLPGHRRAGRHAAGRAAAAQRLDQ